MRAMKFSTNISLLGAVAKSDISFWICCQEVNNLKELKY
jgi:hypothetical protein